MCIFVHENGSCEMLAVCKCKTFMFQNDRMVVHGVRNVISFESTFDKCHHATYLEWIILSGWFAHIEGLWFLLSENQFK